MKTCVLSVLWLNVINVVCLKPDMSCLSLLEGIFCHVFSNCIIIFRNKDLYWQKIVQFHQTRTLLGDDHPNHKQLLYCITTFFLHCLHEYISTLDSGMLFGSNIHNRIHV
jgi:hypothetical protein